LTAALSQWLLAWRIARRELRGGVHGFRIFLACLALGVGAIAAVGSLAAGMRAGMAQDGRALLGGDVEFRLIHRPATAPERAWLEAQGRVSSTLQMRAMAYAARNANAPPPESAPRALVELKAVDGLYPLYGEVRLDPPQTLAQALAQRGGAFGAVVEARALDRLKLKLGDPVQIGDATFQVRATIAREPDRASAGLTFGPRVLVSQDAVAATGLVRPGSLIFYHYRVGLPPEGDSRALIDAANATHADAGWRALDWRNSNPGLRQFIDRIGMFLVLVGLTALLVGGVGVGNAVASYLEGKTAAIATLKCLGATGPLIFRVYLLQVAMLALGGIVMGLTAGMALPAALIGVVSEVLPVPIRFGFYPRPLALAALYGVLVGLAFALWPLARACEVPPAGLFRDLVAPSRRWPRPAYAVATVAFFVALAGIAVASTDERKFALWFVGGTVGGFALLGLVALGLMTAARKAGRPRWAPLRMALANLHRPGAPTPGIVLSLGVGLSLLVTVALIQGNLGHQVNQRLIGEAPAFYFIDIQPDQVADFERVAKAVPGVGEIARVPSLRGRIVKVGTVSADSARVTPDQRWVLRGDRGLTFAALPPPDADIVAGQWWPQNYAGPPLISMGEEAARGLGITVGDTLTVNVLGREIEARIANLRRIDWSDLGLNFVLIFAPGALEQAPHSYIATVKAQGAAEEAVYRAITDRFANVSAIRMKEILQQIDIVLNNIAHAVRAASAVTLAAGALVLGGAIVAGHRRRVREAVLLKVLGATRLDVLRLYVVEYALVGMVAAAVATGLGWLSAWLVVTKVMASDWINLPVTLILTAFGGVVVTVGLGLAGTWRALSVPPARVLRQL
jgi:putative ABC transport system permease protein